MLVGLTLLGYVAIFITGARERASFARPELSLAGQGLSQVMVPPSKRASRGNS